MAIDKNNLDDHVLDQYAIFQLNNTLSQEELEALAHKQMIREMELLRKNDPQRLLDEMVQNAFIKNECHC